MSNFKIIDESPHMLDEYCKVSMKYKVESEFRIELLNNGIDGIKFIEESVKPYWKNYDSEEDNPSLLSNIFNLKNWHVISAFDDEKRIGGAIIAYNTPGVNMLEGRDDIAVIWDLRIDKEYRGKGIGSNIFNKCIEWTKSKKCSRVKVETQNNNVNACKFYAKQGAKLSNINKFAYSNNNEVQLIWSIELAY